MLPTPLYILMNSFPFPDCSLLQRTFRNHENVPINLSLFSYNARIVNALFFILSFLPLKWGVYLPFQLHPHHPHIVMSKSFSCLLMCFCCSFAALLIIPFYFNIQRCPFCLHHFCGFFYVFGSFEILYPKKGSSFHLPPLFLMYLLHHPLGKSPLFHFMLTLFFPLQPCKTHHIIMMP